MQKKLYDEEALQADEIDYDMEELTEDQLREKLKDFPIEKVADIVVTSRYIGLYRNLEVEAMQELGNRRAAGNSFNYEEYIETNIKALPVINLTLPNVGSLFDAIKGFVK